MNLDMLRSHVGEWRLSHLETEADLAVIGRENLERLLQWLERRLGGLSLDTLYPSKLSPVAMAEARAEALAMQEELRALTPVAPSRPVFPAWRELTHFNLEDQVVIVTTSKMFSKHSPRLVPERLLLGKVIPSCRHHDGGVTVRTFERTHVHQFEDGHGYNGGIYRGEYLHLAEYHQLKALYAAKDPVSKRFLELWGLHSGGDAPLRGYAASMLSNAISGEVYLTAA